MFEILQELPGYDTEIQSEQILLAIDLSNRFAQLRVATNLQLVRRCNIYNI